MLRRPEPILIALCAAAVVSTALCAAMPIGGDGEAPDWIHLLPTGTIRTVDGRGPYRVADAVALMAASLAQGERLPIDENHAIDLAAPKGEASPARGWIVELQNRADGVWGRVEWTAQGKRLVAGKSYRSISPVIAHAKDGTVQALLRASLTNRPNLRGLTALHQETDMTLLEKLLAALGLPTTTTEDGLVTTVTAMHQAQATSSTALQAALNPIAVAIGLQAGADQAAVLAGVQQLKAGGGDAAAVVALQQELATVTTRLNTVLETGKRKEAEAYVDAEIKRGRVGLKPVRDRYVSMHMADPAGTACLVEAMPVLGGGGQIVPPGPPAANGEVSLNADETKIAGLLGIDPKKMAETIKGEREAAL